MSSDTEAGPFDLRLCDCVEGMAAMPEASVDAIVCDPPYGLEFMGKEWDRLTDIGKTSHSGIATEPGFKGFVLPAYNGSSNVKCRRCGKWRWDHDGRKCECQPAGDFPNVAAHQARIMQAWHEQWAVQALRVLKPGGYLLAFGGTRTYHRLACAVEDAGFELRDTKAWLHGQGFPKNHDVSMAIDKAEGVKRAVVGARTSAFGDAAESETSDGRNLWAKPATKTVALTGAAVTDAAKRWEGWGTALKPAWEPIVVARKPLQGTVAANVLAHGTGALHIDACRVPVDGGGASPSASRRESSRRSGHAPMQDRVLGVESAAEANEIGRMGRRGDPAVYMEARESETLGRYPPNVLLQHAPECAASCVEGCPVAALDGQSGMLQARGNTGPSVSTSKGTAAGYGPAARNSGADYASDAGGASRFFPQLDYGPDDDLDGPPFLYTAKAAKRDREPGKAPPPGQAVLSLFGPVAPPIPVPETESEDDTVEPPPQSRDRINTHPTVKNVATMRWLVRLVARKSAGVVLDPFMGSGTTGIACFREGVRFIGMERDPAYFAIAQQRLDHARRIQRG